MNLLEMSQAHWHFRPVRLGDWVTYLLLPADGWRKDKKSVLKHDPGNDWDDAAAEEQENLPGSDY